MALPTTCSRFIAMSVPGLRSCPTEKFSNTPSIFFIIRTPSRRRIFSMKLQFALWVLVFCAPALWAQSRIGVDGNPILLSIAEEPYHHLVLENSYACSFSVDLRAQKSTALYHPDYD